MLSTLRRSYYYLFILCIFINLAAIPLFEQYQELENKIPYIPLANLPTPVIRCHALEKKLNHAHIYMKRDDLTGQEGFYGGNKVRKLEFLLADALTKGAKRIITYGCVGSNHCLATACCSRKLCLECTLLLKHQPPSPVVHQNLLLDKYFGAELKIFQTLDERNSERDRLLAADSKTYFIPTGGSVTLGVLGYANAALELKKQIDEGVLPEPTHIYIPIGSCGTAAGLTLGIKLANIRSKIIAVAVERGEAQRFKMRTKELFNDALTYLRSLSSDIAQIEFPDEQFEVNTAWAGTQYGLATPQATSAMQLVKDEEHITLETTYSAKAMSGLVADLSANVQPDDVILFWNTYCGLDFSAYTALVDYNDLPDEVHRYFLDKKDDLQAH